MLESVPAGVCREYGRPSRPPLTNHSGKNACHFPTSGTDSVGSQVCDLSSLQTERNLQVRCPKQTVAGCFDSCVAASVYHYFTLKKKKKASSECLNVSPWSCFPRYHACQIEDISLDLCVVIYRRSDSTEEPSSRVKLPPRLSAVTSFRGYTGELFVVCLFKGQLRSGNW